jgi:hypothetical protein
MPGQAHEEQMLKADIFMVSEPQIAAILFEQIYSEQVYTLGKEMSGSEHPRGQLGGLRSHKTHTPIYTKEIVRHRELCSIPA